MSADIQGWPIDLRAVYGRLWKDRDRHHLREDLWVSPDGNLAAMLYGIAEVGVSKDVGRLAVFRGKERPELILNLPQLACWYLHDSTVQFGKDGLLFVHRFRSGRRVLHVGLTAVDTAARRCASVAGLPERFYSVRHIDGTTYGFAEGSPGGAEETVINLGDLPWKNVRSRGDPHRVPRLVARILAPALPLLATAGCAVALYLYARLPMKGTVDCVLPDGPLAHETHFGQIGWPLRYSGPAFFAYLLWLWRLSRRKVLAADRALLLACWACVLLLLSPLVYMGLNCLLDRSEAVVRHADVVGKFESVDPNVCNPVWRLTLASWRPGRTHEILSVTKEEFDRLCPMQSRLVLRLRPGRFGHPWIESYAIAADVGGTGTNAAATAPGREDAGSRDAATGP